MLYGTNLLSLTPGDWTVTNGSVSSTSIVLNAGGVATQSLDTSDLATIPTEVLLSLVASRYTDTYAPDVFVIIHAETAEEETYNYYVPIIDTAAGLCTIVIPMVETAYTILTFSFHAVEAITITEWGMFAPLTQSVDFTEIEAKIPRLLKDYNTSSFSILTPEDTIALISAYITETTEMSGHLSLSYIATTAATLVIRIKDNNTEELYSPLSFNVPIGSGTIGIPHAYLVKEPGYHNFTVTAQVTSGSLFIDTRKVLYIIDGAHFAYSTLDVGAIVSDLALKRPLGESNITTIYAACIDDGQGLIKTCDYANILANAWIAYAQLGIATDIAIEFAGVWDISGSPYIFNTDNEPWVGWVTAGVLTVMQLNSAPTKQELAEDVLYVCAVAGWRNQYTPEDDQGLIFAYIKTDGLAYYRALCQQADYSVIWENEQAITAFTGTATDINAFRTNDFRVGFNILDVSGTTYTYITTRNWPGMSIPIEKLTLSTELTLEVTEITYTDTFADDENLSMATTMIVSPLWALSPFMVSAGNIDDGLGNFGLHVLLTWDENIFGEETNANSFVLSDGFGGGWAGQTITKTDKTLDILFIDFNNASNPVTLTYTPGTLMGEVIPVDADSITFNALGLVPTFIPSPEVVSVENIAEWEVL